MSISRCVGRLDHSTLLMLLMAAISICKAQESGCLYYYITQPSSDQVNCNPWPYIASQSGNDMVLHCDLLGPQNNDILSVEWYHEEFSYEEDSRSSRISLYSSSKSYKKFMSPNSSGDVSHGFKRINFTLFVKEASDSDTGCYWCEVVVQSRDGCFHRLRRSNAFCLERNSAYGGMEHCSILPVDSSVNCASYHSCNEVPLNWNGNPYLLIEEDHQVPDLSSLSPTATHYPIPQSTANLITTLKATPSNGDWISSLPQSRQHLILSTTRYTAHVSDHHNPTMSLSRLQASDSVDALSSVTPTSQVSTTNAILSTTPSPSALSKGTDCHPTTNSSIKDITGNGTLAEGMIESSLSQSPLQIGIFIGIGLCAVLFAIISMLVFGVVMLCQKTESRPTMRNNRARVVISRPMDLRGQAPPLNAVWRTDASPDHPTSVVNSGHVIPPMSVPTYTDIPAIVGSEDSNGPNITQPRASLGRHHLNTNSPDWRTHSLPVLSDKRGSGLRVGQLRHNRHHVSLEGERSLRSRSPDLHYYHILERPEYYNCMQLEGEDCDDVLQGHTGTGYYPKEVTIEDDSGSDSEYHWRVVLTSSTREEESEAGKSSSSKRVGRHLYRRLDHSMMEPHQDYAKVSIGRSQDSESDRDEAHV